MFGFPVLGVSQLHHVIARTKEERGTLIGDGLGAVREIEIIADIDPEADALNFEYGVVCSRRENSFSGQQMSFSISPEQSSFLHRHGGVVESRAAFLDQPEDNREAQVSQRFEKLGEFFGLKVEGQIGRFAFIEEVALEVTFRKTDQVGSLGLRFSCIAKQNFCGALNVAMDVGWLAGRDLQVVFKFLEEVAQGLLRK